jgi:hypothetical protein
MLHPADLGRSVVDFKISQAGSIIGRISSGFEVVPTLLRLEQVADVTDGSPERVQGSSFSFAQVRLEL